jgi:GNAT superfamily N-acetyltransferase
MIRETRKDDREGVLDLITRFYEESLYKLGYNYNRNKAGMDFDIAIQSPLIYSLVIDNGTIDGFVGAIITERMFLKGKTAQELMWYVTPEKRKHGIYLLQEFEKGCKDRGCLDIMMIGIEGTKANRVYELLGYRKQESMYFKEV